MTVKYMSTEFAFDAPGYRVGDDGSVWTIWELVPLGWRRGTKSQFGKEWKRLSLKPRNDGYPRVVLRINTGKYKTIRVHNLVATLFIGPRPEPGMVVCHEDGNKTDNRAEKLRWGTQQENVDDQKKHGTLARGETKNKAKIKTADVIAIRKRLKTERAADVARDMKLSTSHVYGIGAGRFWKHIPLEVGQSCGTSSGGCG